MVRNRETGHLVAIKHKAAVFPAAAENSNLHQKEFKGIEKTMGFWYRAAEQ